MKGLVLENGAYYPVIHKNKKRSLVRASVSADREKIALLTARRSYDINQFVWIGQKLDIDWGK